MSPKIESEVSRLCAEGLTAHQIRLRLTLSGIVLSERSICRYRASIRAEKRRVRDLEAIGRGLGSVQIGTVGAAEILRASAPDWRQKHAGVLRDLFAQFLDAPSGELYCGLAVGLHAFLLSSALSKALEKPHA
jgi:hypothetical protein